MGALDAEKHKETVNNKFENKGYLKSGSSTSEDPDSPNKSNRALNENTSELDRISEAPTNRQTEEKEESCEKNKYDIKDRTLSDNVEAPAPSSPQDIENEQKELDPTDVSHGSSTTAEDLSERSRMFSTDC